MATNPLISSQERFARQVIAQLVASGHKAYFAGGCVRDRLVGRKPKDFDVATDARPDRIREIFGRRRTLAIGAAFGVISVLGDRRQGEDPIEVATFRSDGQYSDGRRPDSVEFASAQEDAQRRDFTINGLFFDPGTEQVIDYVGGKEDLERRIIRAIGNPHERIDEDKLRMLRAVRFAAVFDFDVDTETEAAVTEHADEIQVVSGERIGAEMRRLLACDGAARGLDLLVRTGLAKSIFPALDASWMLEVDQCHPQEQPLSKLGATIEEVARALLAARTEASFQLGLSLTQVALGTAGGDKNLTEVARSWRLSNDETDRTRYALGHCETLLSADQHQWSMIQPILIGRYVADALELAETICNATRSDRAGIQYCKERLSWPPEKLNPPFLVTGDTLKRWGYAAGPQFKQIINQVRDQQLDGDLMSESEAEQFVRDRF